MAEKTQKKVNLSDFDAVLFHTPYCKLVQKSLGRLSLIDFLQNPNNVGGLEKFKNIKLEDSYFDRDVEKAFLDVSKQYFIDKTKPSLLVASQVGNTYTSSLYGGLISLLSTKSSRELSGNKIVLFSYGSGLAATMFSITVKPNDALNKIVSHLGSLKRHLEQRQKVDPMKFEKCLELRQETCHKAPYEPVSCVDGFFPGTYYLTKIDEMHRRFYQRVPNVINGYS